MNDDNNLEICIAGLNCRTGYATVDYVSDNTKITAAYCQECQLMGLSVETSYKVVLIQTSCKKIITKLTTQGCNNIVIS